MNTMKAIQIGGGILAIGLSIPTFLSGNTIMAGGLVVVGAIILYINLRKKIDFL